MDETRKVVDARGRACPEPVMLTKEAIDTGGFGVLEVLVGSESARDNVLRYAGHASYAAALAGRDGPEWKIEIRAEGAE